jgi:branched-chain amino acid transport system ATP-binding protein
VPILAAALWRKAWSMSKPALLRFDAVNTHYGDLHVLKDVNYTTGQGEIVSLLGGNASGKSTTMKTIMGIVRPTTGSVSFDGVPIEKLSTADRVKRAFSPFLTLGGYFRA